MSDDITMTGVTPIDDQAQDGVDKKVVDGVVGEDTEATPVVEDTEVTPEEAEVSADEVA